MSDATRVLAVIDEGQSIEDQAVARKRWLEIAPALIARNISLTVASFTARTQLHSELAELGCTAVSLSATANESLPRSLPLLISVIREHNIQIAHGHEALPAALSGLAALLSTRPHSIYHRYHVTASRKHQLLSRFAASVNQTTIAVSKAALQAARVLDKTKEAKLRVAYNGVAPVMPVDVKSVRMLRQELGLAPATRVVICISRLRREKGVDLLVEAAATMSGDFVVVVVGAGPESERLQKQATSRATPVVFMGHRDDVEPLYALADVVAIPSRIDALPFSGAEAMSAGVPIVATRVGGLPELVIDGKTGILVRPDDPPALGEALTGMLASPATVRRMGAAAKERYIRHFSVDAMTDEWARSYRLLARN